VLLLLLNLLLGEIFAILPVDDGRCDLSDFFTFGVLERDSAGELGVGDEIVLPEGESDGLGALDIGFRVHDLGDGELGDALEGFSVFLLDNSHKHLVEDLTTTYEEAVSYYLGYGMSMEEMMANAGYDPEQMAQMMGGAEGEEGMNMGGDDNSDEDGEAGGEGYVPQSKFGATNDLSKKKKKK
jgi:hypothetical protein